VAMRCAVLVAAARSVLTARAAIVERVVARARKRM